jgi:hypothetical protein
LFGDAGHNRRRTQNQIVFWGIGVMIEIDGD